MELGGASRDSSGFGAMALGRLGEGDRAPGNHTEAVAGAEADGGAAGSGATEEGLTSRPGRRAGAPPLWQLARSFPVTGPPKFSSSVPEIL